MGFDAGIYRYPKYKEKVSNRDLCYIDEYLSYQTGTWAKEHFSSPEEYALYAMNLTEEEKENYTPPSQEAIDFYISKAKMNEYGRMSFSEDIGYWCSNGAGDIFEWFIKLAQDKNIDCDKNSASITVQLEQKDIANFASFCWGYLYKHMPKPCSINKVFKYIKPEVDDEEDYDTDYDIRLMSCDGIEVTYEDGSNRRIETNSEYGCEFSMPTEYYDDWEMSGYINGLEMALNILSTTDFDNEFIQYSGGW